MFSKRCLAVSNKSIAILGSRGIPAHYGGFETFAEELGIRLAASDLDVTVYCEKHADTEMLPEYQQVRLEYLPVFRLGPATTIIFDVMCLWHARKEFDVVYMLGYGASLFCFIPRLWKNEVWINMDGVEWARSKWNWAAKVWFRMMEAIATWTATTVIADAEAIKSHLLTRYPRVRKIKVIAYGAKIVENPAESDILSELNLQSESYYLVVCRLEPENHVQEIVDGFLLSKSDFPLIVVGDIEASSSYVAQLREIRSPRVQFIGTIFDQNKLEFLRWHSRAYFHGHCVGGTNPSLLEALGCGNRVIAHDNAFNREVATGCAEYFSSSAQIPEIIGRIDEAGDMAEVRVAAQERIRNKYSWEKVAQSYNQLLT